MICYDHVFSQSSEPPKDDAPLSKNDVKFMDRQVSALEYKMQTAAKGKIKKPYLPPGSTLRTMSETEEFVNKETDKFITNKKWDKLGVWFQWLLIDVYIKHIPDLSTEQFELVKTAFKLKSLEKVDYDHINKKVIKLNYTIGTIAI
jgi:hypothetical protein